jgi:LCP family protein required for cell wall assembly
VTVTRPPSATRRRSLAVALSFLWPGLGQLYAGRRRAGLVFALPLFVALLVVGVLGAAGVEDLIGLLISPTGALALLLAVVVLGAWRLAAMADAGLHGGPRPPARSVAIVLVVLSLVVVASHAWAGYAAWSLWDASNQVFTADLPAATPVPTATPISPSPSDRPSATPIASPTLHVSDRISVLITGIDSGPGRNHSLNDTLMVVSVDPHTGQVTMLSFPRDIAQFPLWDGRVFSGKINSLMTEAAIHPAQYPDGPLPTVARELGFLLGIPIQYYASVDLLGFQRVIDAVGGVTVNVERAIADPTYAWADGSPRGFYITAGRHHMNGRTALAYARSRMGAGDNDFTRARRQQLLLIALRDRLTDPALLPRLPAFIQAVGKAIRTNFPSARVGEMLKLAKGITRTDITQVVLSPPTYTVHPPTNTTGGTYILKLQMGALEALSVRLFGEDSAYYVAPPPGASSQPPGSSASPAVGP